jgi:hypothetical protein
MFNILSNAVSSLTSNFIFYSRITTYIYSTNRTPYTPIKVCYFKTSPVVLDIPFEVALINRLVPGNVLTPGEAV